MAGIFNMLSQKKKKKGSLFGNIFNLQKDHNSSAFQLKNEFKV